MINSEFSLRDSDIDDFARRGFVKLEGLLSRDFVSGLDQKLDRHMESARSLDWYGSLFNRTQFDFANDDDDVLALLQEPIFSDAMTRVTQRSLLYTQSVGWELKREQDPGLSWHVDTISFAFQPLDDFGCSIWIPTVGIDPERQGGGVSCVSRELFSGRCMFQYQQLLSLHAARRTEDSAPISPEEFARLEYRLIDSPEVNSMLDEHSETERFEVGDVLIFDKYVLHRSCPLTAGPIETRGAFSMRFMDADSRYDLRRARSLQPFQEELHYDHQTAYSLNICSEHGELLVNSPLFEGTRERRVLHLNREGT